MNLKEFFQPNKSVDKKTKTTIIVFWIVSTLLLWSVTNSVFLPSPTGVLQAEKELFVEHNFLQELITSTWLCFKAMFIASITSFIVAYAIVIPFFRPFAAFVAKTRFLTTVGLTFIFAQITPDVSTQKIAILVFGITVFLTTSCIQIIMNITRDELDYARTLRMNEWETTWNVIIVGKFDQMFDMMKQNFAMAWLMLVMVENIARADGGIGVILYDQNKHFHLDSVYAVQITVLILGLFFDWILGRIKILLFPYSELTLERK